MKGRIVAACLLWQAWKIYRNPDVRKTLKKDQIKGGFAMAENSFQNTVEALLKEWTALSPLKKLLSVMRSP